MRYSDSLLYACCPTQVHDRCARLNDAISNSSNVYDFNWNFDNCIELSSALCTKDFNSTCVTLSTSHFSSFYN